MIYLYNYISKPKQIAEEFLKATRLHNYEKIFSLSSIDLLESYRTEGLLINLIDWKFIDKKKVSKEKKELDLSEKAYDEYCGIVNENIRKILKEDTYEAWRAHEIERKKAFEEERKYYYYEDVNKVEYLLDISCTNKLGMTLKKKYVLMVEKDYFRKWKVARFHER